MSAEYHSVKSTALTQRGHTGAAESRGWERRERNARAASVLERPKIRNGEKRALSRQMQNSIAAAYNILERRREYWGGKSREYCSNADANVTVR